MLSVSSPNRRVEITLALDAVGAPVVSVRFRGRDMLLPSRLGLAPEEAPPLAEGLEWLGSAERSDDASWRPVYGEREVIVDRFNEATVRLRERHAPGRLFEIVLRCYDEGAAWRCQLPTQDALATRIVLDELTEFRFPEGTDGYFEDHMEGEYQRLPIGAFPQVSERPLTLVYSHGKPACLLEAGNVDWPRMRLAPHAGGLRAALDGRAEVTVPCASPWRVLAVADRPADLPLRSDLILNLSPPCELVDTSWIRPGKAIREVTLSTEGGVACVDFAAEHGLQYIEYDAGWYGHEYDDAADARTVTPDSDRTEKVPGWSGLDLPAVIAYAASKGIGVWLYVNRRALERQLDELLPLYASWGVAGIKAGFVNVGPQRWTLWMHELVRKAAQHRLMVDIHDEYRPLGYSRTYPNLLTQEGVRGNEHMPTSAHNCTLPFTRAPIGAYDYTYCYGSDRIKTTHAHQLALAVVCYSPLAFFFWYDRPRNVVDGPELELWRHVPTTWDETRFPAGDIGEYAVAARRSGADWFVGVLTNEEAREPTVHFGFLEPGRTYRYLLCRDAQPGEDGGTSRVVVERGVFDAGSRLRVALAASGGCALRLTPVAQHLTVSG
jgi:alpha-glucosidase